LSGVRKLEKKKLQIKQLYAEFPLGFRTIRRLIDEKP